MFDSAGLEVLSRDECLRLLGKVPLGRIVFTDRALPAVQPVQFALHDGAVVIKTAAGTKLAAAARDAVVAFEVDEFDPRLRSGWSVVLVGRSGVITSEGELEKVRHIGLRSWTSEGPDYFIRIGIEVISGRRIPSLTVVDGPPAAGR